MWILDCSLRSEAPTGFRLLGGGSGGGSELDNRSPSPLSYLYRQYIGTPNLGLFKWQTAHTNTNRTQDSRPSKTSSERSSTRLPTPYDEIDRTEMYAAYKDWCVFNRINPESARRFYGSIWDIFRIKMGKSNGRRLFKGIRLVEERTSADADRA